MKTASANCRFVCVTNGIKRLHDIPSRHMMTYIKLHLKIISLLFLLRVSFSKDLWRDNKNTWRRMICEFLLRSIHDKQSLMRSTSSNIYIGSRQSLTMKKFHFSFRFLLYDLPLLFLFDASSLSISV